MKKCNLEVCQEFALNKDGKLISTEYINALTKMSWECKEKHQWEANWNSVRQGSWCPYCAWKVKKCNITELQKFARSRSGKLVSIKYINSKTKMLWEGEEGHQWEAKWTDIKNKKSWCPYCSGSVKPNITELQEYAINKGGKLVSTEYINNITKMLWECEEGHQWEAKWTDIKNKKSWCPGCSSLKPNITELQEYAINKGGKLVSTEYINNITKMLWKCEKGHEWKANWGSIKNSNSWCAICARKAKPDIIELQNFAKSKKGKLLSTTYIDNSNKLLWECKETHQWEANWGHIKNSNTWCPECASFKTELRCKELLESKFGFTLTKTRFLYDSKRYEWDGYNEDHKIAFEYHGYQHYIYPNYFHKTEEQYLKARQRDIEKVQYAKENNIKLIIIPYTEEKNLEQYIEEITV